MKDIAAIAGLVLLAGSGTAWCGQAERIAGGGHIFRRVELEAAAQTAGIRRAFESFCSEYSAGLEPILRREHTELWEFWVVLRRDPKRHDRPHILVLGRSDGLLVRLADIALDKPVNTTEAARKVVRTSAAAASDPTFHHLARGRRDGEVASHSR